MNIECLNLLSKSNEASPKRSDNSKQEPFSGTLKNQLDYAQNAQFNKNNIKAASSESEETETSVKSAGNDDEESVNTDETLLEMLPLPIQLSDNTGKLSLLQGGAQKANPEGNHLTLGLLNQGDAVKNKQMSDFDNKELSALMSDFAKKLTSDEFKSIQDTSSSLNPGAALLDVSEMSNAKSFAEDINTSLLSNAASSLSQAQAPEVLTVAKPLAHPDWDKQLADQIVWLAHKGIDSAEIKLNPEHLGPVSIRVDVEHDQTSIQFTTSHLAVKEALEASLPKLKEIFASQQLNLVDVNILSNTGSQHADSGSRQQEYSTPGLNPVEVEQHEEGVVVKRLADVRLLNTYA